MNIIQVQDRLKGVSDDALKGYVTNPTGEVPTYLALGEIGRREDVRKEYQAAQADQPQKTVAEEKLAAMPTRYWFINSRYGNSRASRYSSSPNAVYESCNSRDWRS